MRTNTGKSIRTVIVSPALYVIYTLVNKLITDLVRGTVLVVLAVIFVDTEEVNTLSFRDTVAIDQALSCEYALTVAAGMGGWTLIIKTAFYWNTDPLFTEFSKATVIIASTDPG